MSPHDEKELSRFMPGVDIKSEQIGTMAVFREEFKCLAEIILKRAPASADRSAAIRYLRLAHMQVNAAICHDWPEKENENS